MNRQFDQKVPMAEDWAIPLDPKRTPITKEGTATITFEQACQLVRRFVKFALIDMCGELSGLRDSKVQESTCATTHTFAFSLSNSLRVCFSKQVWVDRIDWGHSPLEPSYDMELMSHLGLPDIDANTPFWWCNVATSRVGNKKILVLCEPQNAEYILFFTQRFPADVQVMTEHISACDMERDAKAVILPVGFENVGFLDGVDGETVEQYFERRASMYRERHQSRIDVEKPRRNKRQHPQLSNDKKAEICRTLRAKTEPFATSLYLTKEEKQQLILKEDGYSDDKFFLGAKVFSFNDDDLKEVSKIIEDAEALIKKRQKELFMAEAFMRAAKQFPIDVKVDMYCFHAWQERPELKVRSPLILFIFRDFIQLTIYNSNERVEHPMPQTTMSAPDLVAWQYLYEAYRKTRKWWQKIYDSLFLHLTPPEIP